MQKARLVYLTRSRYVAVLAASVAFALTAAASPASAAELFTNDTQITIPSSGSATPSPSTINVQGQTGVITDVGVTLKGFTHSDAGDVDVLLVSPGGRTSLVLSDACQGGTATGANLFFTTTPGFDAVPSSGDCLTSIYRVTNYGGGDAFTGAPAGPHTANLDNLIGGPPNGDWSLYVVDDASGDSGKFTGGWSLTLQTAPAFVTVPGFGDTGKANPYPMTKTISGVDGVITDVDATLGGVHLERAQDLDVLLVSPSGDKVMLVSDACGLGRVKSAYWTFDDEAPGPTTPNFGCPTRGYRPANNFPNEVMPAPAPVSPYAPTMSVFDRKDPNGEWKLYASDDLGPDGDGFLTEPLRLDITTRPRTKADFAKGEVEITEGQQGRVDLVRPNAADLGRGIVKVTSSPVSATPDADFRPVTGDYVFPRDVTSTSVGIEAFADDLPEGTEEFRLTMSAPREDAALGTTTSVVVKINDPAPRPDDTPTGDTPGGGGTTPDPTTNGPPPDRTAPVVGKLAFKPAAFAVARGATAKTAREPKPKRGTRIGYTLTEAATVSLRIERRKGRRFKKVATLKRSGKAGANRVAFTGRIGRKALKPGAYRVVVTAADAAGNRSAPRPRSFRVVD